MSVASMGGDGVGVSLGQVPNSTTDMDSRNGVDNRANIASRTSIDNRASIDNKANIAGRATIGSLQTPKKLRLLFLLFSILYLQRRRESFKLLHVFSYSMDSGLLQFACSILHCFCDGLFRISAAPKMVRRCQLKQRIAGSL